jgi:hypothetical protein
MLDALENIQLWNQGLKKLNDTTPRSSSSSFATDVSERQQQTSDNFLFTELPKLANAIVVNATLQELLHRALDDKGRLSGTTFPLIGRLRARVRSMKNDILATLNALLATPSLQSKLALESGGPVYSQLSGSGRLVLPVSPKYASSVGMVHDTSRSGKTIFVEPHEIVGPTNELKQLEGELRTEEARVWRSLTRDIVSNRAALETSVAVVGQLDLVLARYRLGQKFKGVVPVVRDEGVVQLQNAKHPVLLLRRANLDDVVGSDIELGMGKNQGLVLTGGCSCVHGAVCALLDTKMPGMVSWKILTQAFFSLLYRDRAECRRKNCHTEVVGPSGADGPQRYSSTRRRRGEWQERQKRPQRLSSTCGFLQPRTR